MAKSWNLDGLYRHAQGVKERGRVNSHGRVKRQPQPQRQPWTCPKCGKQIDTYRATHLEICNG